MRFLLPLPTQRELRGPEKGGYIAPIDRRGGVAAGGHSVGLMDTFLAVKTLELERVWGDRASPRETELPLATVPAHTPHLVGSPTLALAHVGRVGVCGERGLIMKEIKTVKAVWSWAGSSPYEGSDKGGARGANATPTAASIVGPQPPAKQVCDIMPLVPLRGPGEQAGGPEQRGGWRRKQRESHSLPLAVRTLVSTPGLPVKVFPLVQSLFLGKKTHMQSAVSRLQ
ncbi:hypothetical protein EYF80_007992 [Liparis tanakae]|uniref:Uncharacterized protein n=1 Tax=Liparis tanakae TaxID=230148 RepID=A0A4Z2IX79_9TELE|nr:hypothetical protein EYF80_007992 [Liparis tanakae]